jgi:hypothetical protein
MGKVLSSDAVMQLINEALACKPNFVPMAKGRKYDRSVYIKIEHAPRIVGQYLARKEELREEGKVLEGAELKLNLLKQTILYNMAELTVKTLVAAYPGSENALVCVNGAIVFPRERPHSEIGSLCATV